MNKQETATNELLKILSTEIAKDGGASLVVCLKDYTPHRNLDKLLKASNSMKLLRFLEDHPDVFEVNRQSVPHFVKLVSEEFCQSESTNRTENELSELQSGDDELYALQQQILTALRKRDVRINRRQRGDHREVNSYWLLNECTSSFHLYLRASGVYREQLYTDCHQVRIKGTPEWQELVLPCFEAVLQQMENIIVQDGKVVLKSVMIDGQQQQQERVDDTYLRQLGALLDASVSNDRAQHISLRLLLHRCPQLRDLVGGRDLLRLVEENPDYFVNTEMFTYENEVYFQSKTEQKTGRMKVDEVGNFSLAGSSKWKRAMISRLVSACKILGLDPGSTTAVDLTASVGGFTLELARTFSNVIAVEIDAHRADLCKQNMQDHGIHNVAVRNNDAMKEIPNMPSQSVVVIDPPWGGVYYKSEKNQPLCSLGQWPLDEVVRAVANHLNPVVVGLRLPVNFDLDTWLATLAKKEGLPDFEASNIRKLGPQIFAVLAFPSSQNVELPSSALVADTRNYAT